LSTRLELGDSLKKLGKDMEDLSSAMRAEASQAVAGVAQAALSFVTGEAQAKLHATRQDYLSGLSLEQVGPNEFVIVLSGDAALRIENGWGAYDLRAVLLRSRKIVSVGRRAGQPWVRIGKLNQKYASVPFQQQPFSKAGGASSSADVIAGLYARNARGRRQKLTSVFNDADGNPMEGKVASVTNPALGNLSGITKYQKKYTDPVTGKQTVQGIYATYRTVSENGKPWNHPGYNGLHAFQRAEKFVEEKLDEIAKVLVEAGD
jgi:hypothetical protein